MSEAGRIAIVAHSHPRLHAGGGEVAAWRQFDALRAAGDDVYFLGTVTDGSRLGRAPGEVAAFDDRDLALVAPPMDGFGMEHPNPVTEGQILDLLLRLGADTYHFHHIWNVGAGTIRRLRAARPQARLLLTLHEMASVCALHGQMVKAGGALCTGWGPEDCAACLPGRVPLSMVLRRRRLLEVLALMDLLIAPSRFVAARHEDWGIPPGRIRLIENGFPDAALPPPAPCPMPEEAADLSRRFAFFGNATPTKGLDVLIAAAALTDPDRLSVEVHGLDADTLAALLPGRPIPANVTARGRYRPEEAVALMRGQGWIVVPSTWWENAPVVIDESRAAGRVVIASDIGGMAEKTAGWGLQFPVGDAGGLAALMTALAGDGARWAAMARAVPAPVLLSESLARWRAALTGAARSATAAP